MKHGDAYLYYVQVYGYYLRVLDFNIANSKDASSYFQAYKCEAMTLETICTNSILLNSSSQNQAYFYRGLARVILGNCNGAVSDFRTAMNSNDKSLCYYNIGIAYANNKRYLDAIDYMKQVNSNTTSKKIKEQSLSKIKEYQDKINER